MLGDLPAPAPAPVGAQPGRWRRAGRLWHACARLSGSQRLLLFECWLLLPFIAGSLRLFGFRRVQAFLAHWSAAGNPRRTALGARPAEEVSWLVATAARLGPYRASCLPRALALWWLLRRQGNPVDLRIGVRTIAGQLMAHAWVEHEGVALDGDPDTARQFAPFEGGTR